jgi:hypothetical protein
MQIAKIVAAVAIMLTAALAGAKPALAEQSFRILDRVAADEVEEITTLIVNGRTIRSFHLDADEREIAIGVTVPTAESHEFGLCGHILIRAADGTTMRRSFDISGLLYDVDGRDFEAVASEGYTHFYLVDTTPGRLPAKIEPLPGHACTPAVS